AVSDNQDFRKYGGLKNFLPITYSVMLIASFSLVAFPFMSGFYSKDFILESSYGQFYFSGIVVYFIATIGAIFTTLYSVKILYFHSLNEIMLNTEFAVPTFFKLLPLILTLVFSFLAFVLNEFLPKLFIYFKISRLGYNLFGFFNQRFLIELFYNKYIINVILNLGGQTTKIIDKGSIELLGPFGLEKGLISLSKSIVNLSTGN